MAYAYEAGSNQLGSNGALHCDCCSNPGVRSDSWASCHLPLSLWVQLL